MQQIQHLHIDGLFNQLVVKLMDIVQNVQSIKYIHQDNVHAIKS